MSLAAERDGRISDRRINYRSVRGRPVKGNLRDRVFSDRKQDVATPITRSDGKSAAWVITTQEAMTRRRRRMNASGTNPMSNTGKAEGSET